MSDTGGVVAPADRDRGRLASIAPIVIFDVVGPLVAYYALRDSGSSTVTALILSGTVPLVGIAIGIVQRRRIDALGVLVVIGIAIGALLGVVSGNAHLVLLDGTVPTAIFGVICFGSLRASRPLLFTFALEAMGPDTRKGQDFAALWRYPGFRHAFRVITVVWGTAYLLEAGAQAAIVETASTGVAKTTSNVMPLAVAGVVIIWTTLYGRRRARQRAPPAIEAGSEMPATPEAQ